MRIIGTILVFTFGLAAPALAIDDGTGEVDTEEDWEEYGDEASYCGGGDETLVEQAWTLYESGNQDLARQTLADALKHGRVDAWERADALATLAYLQLGMGDARPAAYNYGRAIELGPERANLIRFGYVAALYLTGRTEEALEVSRTHIREVCETGARTIDCYGAYLIVSRHTEDATEMFEAMRSAESTGLVTSELTEFWARIFARIRGD